MELLYKPDWEETKERYKAWWAHEYFGRCGLWVTAPKADLPPGNPPPLPEKVEDRWLDLDYVKVANAYYLPRAYYGGEAFPIWTAGYPGWATIPCFLGCSVKLSEDTGWVDPILDKGELTDYDYRKLVIDPENSWWKLALEVLKLGVKESKGKAIPSTGAFGGCGDTLSMLRSSNQLLYDVVTCPEYVQEFEMYLMRQWCEVFDVFYDILHKTAEGSADWFPLWSPGKFYPAHNDFSYMISPKMFRDIFLPILEFQTNFMDNMVYHVDGIGAFAHVDALCELPRLQAFQILPGSGKPSPLHYMDVLKKVQSYGKNLHISIPANEIEYALENLSARGLFITTCVDSEEEARQLLKNAEKWSVDRG